MPPGERRKRRKGDAHGKLLDAENPFPYWLSPLNWAAPVNGFRLVHGPAGRPQRLHSIGEREELTY